MNKKRNNKSNKKRNNKSNKKRNNKSNKKRNNKGRGLSDLPPEIITDIEGFLDIKDLIPFKNRTKVSSSEPMDRRILTKLQTLYTTIVKLYNNLLYVSLQPVDIIDILNEIKLETEESIVNGKKNKMSKEIIDSYIKRRTDLNNKLSLMETIKTQDKEAQRAIITSIIVDILSGERLYLYIPKYFMDLQLQIPDPEDLRELFLSTEWGPIDEDLRIAKRYLIFVRDYSDDKTAQPIMFYYNEDGKIYPTQDIMPTLFDSVLEHYQTTKNDICIRSGYSGFNFE